MQVSRLDSQSLLNSAMQRQDQVGVLLRAGLRSEFSSLMPGAQSVDQSQIR